MEFAGLDLQPTVEVVGEGECGRFADADHPHGRGADDADLQVGKFDLERDGGEEPGAAATNDEDARRKRSSAVFFTPEVWPSPHRPMELITTVMVRLRE